VVHRFRLCFSYLLWQAASAAEEGQGHAPSTLTYPVRCKAWMGGRAEIAEDSVQADDAVLDHVLQEVNTDQVPTCIDAVLYSCSNSNKLL
jgi:hypothetical protein